MDFGWLALFGLVCLLVFWFGLVCLLVFGSFVVWFGLVGWLVGWLVGGLLIDWFAEQLICQSLC
jgi:hypothetical protein